MVIWCLAVHVPEGLKLYVMSKAGESDHSSRFGKSSQMLIDRDQSLLVRTDLP